MILRVATPPTTDFRTFEDKAELFELTSQFVRMNAQRGLDGRSLAVEGKLFAAWMLRGREQRADGIGRVGRRAEINRALSAAVAVAERVVGPKSTFADRAYAALKEVIVSLNIYNQDHEIRLDERQLASDLGVSRTPVREAMAQLEREGFVRSVPRRGVYVVKKKKRDVIELITAWAALESMAARLITQTARKRDITALRDFFKDFHKDRLPQDHVEEYSKANIAFHQALISLSESQVLINMTNGILLHVRRFRQLTIGRSERIAASLPERLAIIGALEERKTELAEKFARDHTLGLATYVETHGDGLFG